MGKEHQAATQNAASSSHCQYPAANKHHRSFKIMLPLKCSLISPLSSPSATLLHPWRKVVSKSPGARK